jgi:hypothetical protein
MSRWSNFSQKVKIFKFGFKTNQDNQSKVLPLPPISKLPNFDIGGKRDMEKRQNPKNSIQFFWNKIS